MPKSVESCPLKQGSILAKTVPDPLGGVSFTLSPDGDVARSGGSGAVQFQTLEPGPYEVSAALSGDDGVTYKLAEVRKGGSVTGGGRLDLDFTVDPTKLSVKLSGPDKRDGIRVRVESDSSRPSSQRPVAREQTTNDQGVADFGLIPAGGYNVIAIVEPNHAAADRFQRETRSTARVELGTTVEHPVALSENPPLEVTVLTRSPDQNLSGVKVKIDAVNSKLEATTGSNGVARFDHARLTEYTIELEFTVEDAKAYKKPAASRYTVRLNQTNATTIVVEPSDCEVHLAPVLKMPDDSLHALPQNLTAKLRVSDNTTQDLKLNEKGVFVVASSSLPPVVKRTLKFTLEFPKMTNAWLVFEKAGASATQELVVDAAPKFKSELCKKTAVGHRAILWLQADAKLIELDVALDPTDHFTKPDFDFKGKTFIGTASAPVKLVIKPKWQYLRFEYFDRKHGKASHGNKRISVPPVILKASRKTDDGTLKNLAAGGNFMHEPTDQAKACHALAWIVTKKADDGADLPKLDKTMYFQFGEANAWVEAKSATEREYVELNASGSDKEKLKPSKDRNKFYDLPELWTNCFQLTRLPADKVKFFDELTEDEIEASYDKSKPLIFSLDDIVLTTESDTQAVKDKSESDSDKDLSEHSRVAILHLDPDDKYNVKIWDPITTAVYHSKKAFVKDGADKYRNVLAEYAPNARAVIFCNGVYHVYDKRTKTATYSDKHVKGARAARLNDADVATPKRVFSNNSDCYADANFSPVSGGAGFVHKPRSFPLYYLHYGDTDGTTVYGILLTLYSFRFFDNTGYTSGSYTSKDITTNYDDVRKYQNEGLKTALDRWNGKKYRFEENDDKTDFVIFPFYFFESKDVEKPNGTVNKVGGKQDCACPIAAGDGNNHGSSATSSGNEMYMRKSGYRDEGPGWASTPPGADPTVTDYDGTPAVARCALAHEIGHAAVGLFDDYLTEKYPSSTIAGYKNPQRYAGVPYNIDPVTMMSMNRAVRLRFQWGRVLWVNAEAKSGKALEKFVGTRVFRAAYEPAGKKKLKYYLPSGTSIYKPAKESKDHDLGDNGKANLYLYPLGEDEFSVGMQNGPYDGILVVEWNIAVQFVDGTAASTNWAANTAYTVGAERKQGIKSYRCTANHTSSATFTADSSKWAEYTPVTWDATKKRQWIEDLDKRFKQEFEGAKATQSGKLDMPNEGRFKLTSGGAYKKVYVRAFPQWQEQTASAPANTHFTVKVTGNGKDTFTTGSPLDVGDQVDSNTILRYILGRYTASTNKKATLALADLDPIQSWIKTNTGNTHDYAGEQIQLTLTSFAPTGGAAEGADVTLTGTNLADVTSVSFGGVAQTTIASKTATQLVCKVPANAVTGKIKVGTSNRSAESSTDFKVLPAITSVEPSAPAKIDADVTINGTSLTAASAVKFGAVTQATYTVDSATKITTKVPAGAVTAKITVTTAAGTATSPNDFTVIPPPVITSFAPTSAKVGDDVTLTGTGLNGATAVKIGGVAATIKTNTATSLVATVGAGAANGSVEVTTPGGDVTKTGYTLAT